MLMRSWLADRGGQFALILGMLAPVALGVVGCAIDMIVFVNHRSELQATADAAVLAVASEASLKGWNAGAAEQVAGAVVKSNLSDKFGVEHHFKLLLDQKSRRVEIQLDQDHYGYFVMGYFAPSPQIKVSAAAFASAASTICIITQSPTQSDALVVNGNSKIRANDCGAYSNSTSTKGINVKDLSLMRTQMACSAGGYAGKLINFWPLPLTDCPPIADPLAARAKMIDAEVPAGCDNKKLTVKGGKKTLQPGTYCDGLTITDGAQVVLDPGIYVINNESLKVDKAAKITGKGVGLIFTGKNAKMELANDSAVSLSAPETGSMAGILIYGQPSGKQRKFSLVSKDAQSLTGTVYLPTDTLTVGGDDDLDGGCDPIIAADGTLQLAAAVCLSDVGTSSDWTAIVVKQLKVTAGSTLVMNANYEGSSVPVPAGLGPSSGHVVLAR
jgi:Flp pilus assembly protein TadG